MTKKTPSQIEHEKHMARIAESVEQARREMVPEGLIDYAPDLQRLLDHGALVTYTCKLRTYDVRVTFSSRRSYTTYSGMAKGTNLAAATVSAAVDLFCHRANMKRRAMQQGCPIVDELDDNA